MTSTRSPTLERVKKAVEDWEEHVNKQLFEFGVSDTEPRAVLERQLEKAFMGEKFEARTASQWQIYENRGCAKAAAVMNRCGREIVEALRNTPICELEDARKLIWRIV